MALTIRVHSQPSVAAQLFVTIRSSQRGIGQPIPQLIFMKKITIMLAVAILSASAVFIFAFITADRSKFNNNFVRVFPPHAADLASFLKTEPDRFFLSGLSKEYVFLRDKYGILRLNLKLNDSVRTDLELQNGSDVLVDSPYFFIRNESTISFEYGCLDNWKVERTFPNLPGFTAIRPISLSTAVLRSNDFAKRENFLMKSHGTKKFVLQKQVDGILCTDGLLDYSPALSTIVYTYRYRNQFICLDTNLNVLRFGKTIDTTSVAKIGVADTGDKVTLSKPPLMVNRSTSIDGKFLFVHSNLMARNEFPDQFQRRSVIDVYDLTDASYLFSFYIENYHGLRMQKFVVRNSILVAIFKDAVSLYYLQLKYLPD
jgi:hypothetical protein